MPNYAYNGHCYASQAEALTAFNQSFPMVGEQNFISLQSSSITGGLISYTAAVRPVTANKETTITGKLALSQCTEPDAAFDPSIAAGIWSGCFIWILTLYLISKNVGVILEAIRKF